MTTTSEILQKARDDWKPIETAPSGIQVELGRWDVWKGEYRWETTNGTPFEKKFFGLLVFQTFEARRYTHWRYLPDAPSEPPAIKRAISAEVA